MVSCRKKFLRVVAMCMQREYLVVLFLFLTFFNRGGRKGRILNIKSRRLD